MEADEVFVYVLYFLSITLHKHLASCCFQIITCILTERKMVLFSSDWALLTLVAECFMLYLHPLQWQHTFVPLLSRHMLDFVMAPTSFLMGCHADHFEVVSTVRFLTDTIDTILAAQFPCIYFLASFRCSLEHFLIRYIRNEKTESNEAMEATPPYTPYLSFI